MRRTLVLPPESIVSRTEGLRRGFTLIELIIVMMVMATVLALSAPALSRFFGGQDLTDETRRIQSLTRLARSEAVCRPEPMELWIEPSTGKYGLRAKEGYAGEKDKSWEFHLADGLVFEVEDSVLDSEGLARIEFRPDGTAGEYALDSLTLRNGKDDRLSITQAEDGLDFVVGSADSE